MFSRHAIEQTAQLRELVLASRDAVGIIAFDDSLRAVHTGVPCAPVMVLVVTCTSQSPRKQFRPPQKLQINHQKENQQSLKHVRTRAEEHTQHRGNTGSYGDEQAFARLGPDSSNPLPVTWRPRLPRDRSGSWLGAGDWR